MIAATQIFLGRGGGAKLPYDAEVEYLESTGTQYIDTGIVAKPTTSMEISLQVVRYNDGCTGSYYSGGMYYINFWANKPYYRYGAAFLSGTQGEPGWNASGRNNIQFANGTIIYNNVVFASDIDVSGLGSNNSAFYLFAYNSGNNTVRGLAYLRIFSFKITDGNNTICDMFPVRFTNELGHSEGAMYDRISKQLFRNQGTGTFLYGGDVYSVPVETSQYVEDGLVAMWDGKENAGVGKRCDTATSWVDLSGNGNNLTLFNPTYVDGIMHFTQGAYAQGSLQKLPADVTIEFAHRNLVKTRAEGQTQDTWSAIFINHSNYTYGGYYIEYNASGFVGIRADTSYSGRWNFGSAQVDGTATLVADGGNKYAYQNGESKGSTSRNLNESFAPQFVRVGQQDANQWLTADYCNIRIYSRALTAAEIAANYAVDKQRFNLP